jgi:hypothetical protein
VAQTPVTAVRPVVAQYDPAVHDEHILLELKAEKYPAVHAVHEVELDAE